MHISELTGETRIWRISLLAYSVRLPLPPDPPISLRMRGAGEDSGRQIPVDGVRAYVGYITYHVYHVYLLKPVSSTSIPQ